MLVPRVAKLWIAYSKAPGSNPSVSQAYLFSHNIAQNVMLQDKCSNFNRIVWIDINQKIKSSKVEVRLEDLDLADI